MAIVWMQGNSFTKIATLYTGNITFNTPCIEIFKDVQWCLIGIDRDENKVAVQLVTEDDIAAKKYIPEILNRVSVGKSYVRICNKSIIHEISTIINKDCDGIKFLVNYDKNLNQVIIDMNKPI